MFELDVLLSQDGRVVVIHDDTLDRTTDGEGEVAAFTLAELQEEMSPEAVMAEVSSNGFNLSRRQVDAGIVAACHGLERPVAVYTVNEINEMERLIDLGVDAIFTDRPDRLLRVLGTR